MLLPPSQILNCDPWQACMLGPDKQTSEHAAKQYTTWHSHHEGIVARRRVQLVSIAPLRKPRVLVACGAAIISHAAKQAKTRKHATARSRALAVSPATPLHYVGCGMLHSVSVLNHPEVHNSGPLRPRW
jgi:hypothetical protein